MNNYGVPNGTYLKSFSQKIPQLFIIHQQSDFIIHYSLRDCCILQQSLCALFRNMRVVGDMLGAVAVVAAAAGAVAELQLGGIHIGAAADGALVGVGSLGLGMGGLVAAGIVEGDDLGAGIGGLFTARPALMRQVAGNRFRQSLPKNRK